MKKDDVKISDIDCKALVRQIPDPLLAFTRTGVILIASKAFEDVSGYTLDEVQGKNAFTMGLVCKESLSTVRKNLLKRFLGQKIGLYDVMVKIKNGDILIAEVNGGLVDLGGTKAVLTVFRDVTAKRKEMEENTARLREASRRLEEKLSELEKMNHLMVGRELKMVELKEKLENLDK